MKYAFLIYNSEVDRSKATPVERAEIHDGYVVVGKEMAARGVNLVGEVLHPATTATTVRTRNGKIVTSDGPFAETHEQLGGFYVIECQDLDEAIEWARKIPGSLTGSVEIRPVAVFEQ